MDVKGAVAIVTGGASGLGEAVSRRLDAGGARVVVVDRDADRAKHLAAELADARWVAADVTDEESIRRAVDAALDAGALRIVVNCAGIGWAQRTVDREGGPADLGAFRHVIDVNLIGTFNVTRLAAAAMSRLDPMPAGGRGVVVNTASCAAFDGQIGQAAYSASKAGVAGMTLPLARDLAILGIRVMTIAPGTFDTPLLRLGRTELLDTLARDTLFPRRVGDPAEFAHLVEAIVENDYLNGEVIRLDAGIRMQPK